MMIHPPIDKLIDKVGCKYALVCLITKRAKFLADKKSDMLESTNSTPVTFAAAELFNDRIKPAYED